MKLLVSQESLDTSTDTLEEALVEEARAEQEFDVFLSQTCEREKVAANLRVLASMISENPDHRDLILKLENKDKQLERTLGVPELTSISTPDLLTNINEAAFTLEYGPLCEIESTEGVVSPGSTKGRRIFWIIAALTFPGPLSVVLYATLRTMDLISKRLVTSLMHAKECTKERFETISTVFGVYEYEKMKSFYNGLQEIGVIITKVVESIKEKKPDYRIGELQKAFLKIGVKMDEAGSASILPEWDMYNKGLLVDLKYTKENTLALGTACKQALSVAANALERFKVVSDQLKNEKIEASSEDAQNWKQQSRVFAKMVKYYVHATKSGALVLIGLYKKMSGKLLD